MDIFTAGKLIPLVAFSAFFVGVCIWALLVLSPERAEQMRRVPFKED